ncbi:type VII secretion protein EccB [Cellulomonas shaoxiangyii]|uniref:Type VII secretion protein EccB n=1 Tax=Cellulomonas shaoxiangyii TaxID=2566013 RepID=A0A4P7SMY9_9CELL|nr:type VII secretion protein EccB [Cellulomonas shaoxiangyii]QCB94244.1 type VII secretion protein EccB [Cellulomonas shaoxiangyii]TGY78297.1 type VII secretion protein EccB [Cellulomonas shaoxiangyii]
MASKKDLIEAQTFSRRRLLTAFTSGAPGGKELEPTKPMRGVVAGLALTALVVVGGLFYGFLRPGLPAGWDNNRLVVAEDTGARYVSVGGTLHPVANTTSARLIVPAGEFDVVTTSAGRLADAPLGQPVGIVGAPDQLPPTDRLLGTGWAACLVLEGTEGAAGVAGVATTLSATAPAVATDGAAVVRTEAGTAVLVGGTSFPVDADGTDAVLRAVGLGDADVRDVTAAWLRLFTPGTELSAIVVRDAGGTVEGTELRVGQVVHPQGSPATTRFLVREDGSLAPLSPLAYQLYLLGTGAQLGEALDVPSAAIAALKTSPTPAGAADWPTREIAPVPDADAPCALATDADGEPGTVLGVASDDAAVRTVGQRVDHGAGALVRAGGRGAQSSGGLYLVDATGTAFPVVGGADTLTRLGYATEDVGGVTDAWIALLPTGPVLSTEVATRGVTVADAGATAEAGTG